jgi:hypothetical protein
VVPYQDAPAASECTGEPALAEAILAEPAGASRLLRQFYHSSYWRYRDDLGDASAENRRTATTLLIRLQKAARDASASAALESLHKEILRRVASPDPSWDIRARIANSVRLSFPQGDQAAIDVLATAVERERHPLVRFYLQRSLGQLNGTGQGTPASSVLVKAQEALTGARKQNWQGILGEPDEFRDFLTYRRTLKNQVPSLPSADFVGRLERDFLEHTNHTTSDALIQAEVIETLASFLADSNVALDVRAAIQRTLFQLLKSEQPDHEIRIRLLHCLSSAGWSEMGDDAALELFQHLLKNETYAQARATLETYCLQITDPASLR